MDPGESRAPVRTVPLALGLLFGAWTTVRVFAGHPYLTVCSWIVSIGLLVGSFPAPSAATVKHPKWPRLRGIAFAAVVCLPTLVRLADIQPDRIHGDEILTGYFSATYDLRRTDFFAPVPADPTVWVAQFPAPYFVLQKLFFEMFGASLLTIKLSALPYVVVAGAMLFAIARDLLDERAAALAVVVYAFFAPSAYLDTLGVHFISSTAAFLVFFYFAVRELRHGLARDALLAGLSAGSCYLFYLSSYLALPLAIAFFFLRGARRRERHVARNMLIFSLGFIAVVAPFVARWAREPGVYLRRFEQVALLGGEWSPYRAGGSGAKVPPTDVVAQNLRLSLRSLHAAGVGGHGGYEFGKQALLGPLALALALAGVARAVALARRRSEWWLVIATIVLAFLTGMVLTIPPPAFHRASIAFPFLALLISLPLHALIDLRIGRERARYAVAAAILAGFIVTQRLDFLQAVLPEAESSPLRLARFIDARFPDRPLYVAAFPSYLFEKLYHFAATGHARAVTTGYHVDLLARLDPARKYVYVVTLPDQFASQFASRDPHGRMIRFTEEFGLFVN